MPATNRVTGKPLPQQGDQTAIQQQALEAKKLEEAATASAKAEELADVEEYEKKNVIIDYYADADTPLEEVAEDEVTSTQPFREVVMKYEIENMVFGRKLVREPEYILDDHGKPTWEVKRPAELGGLRFYSFKEGRKYRLPRPLADHLDEHGYVFH